MTCPFISFVLWSWWIVDAIRSKKGQMMPRVEAQISEKTGAEKITDAELAAKFHKLLLSQDEMPPDQRAEWEKLKVLLLNYLPD